LLILKVLVEEITSAPKLLAPNSLFNPKGLGFNRFRLFINISAQTSWRRLFGR